MLPSALSRSDSFRSVHVGRPQFSRCCHLIGDLSFSLSVETWARPLTQSPELGFGLLSFSLPGTILTLLLPFVLTQLPQLPFGAIVQGRVHFSAHPRVMQ